MRTRLFSIVTAAFLIGAIMSPSQAAAPASDPSQRLAEQYESLRQRYYSPAVELKDRELAAVAALVTLPGVIRIQLVRQINAALDAGATREELIDGLAALSEVVGDVRSFEALRVVSDVLSAREELTPRGPPTPEIVHRKDGSLDSAETLRNRDLFVVCAFVSSNTVGTPITAHIDAALRAGWTKQQLREVFGYLALYGGIPNAMSSLSALNAAVAGSHGVRSTEVSRLVFIGAVRPAATDLNKGMANLRRLNPEGLEQGDGWRSAEAAVPGLYGLGIGYLYGDLLTRRPLDDRVKLIAIISAITARGGNPEQLAFHIETALNAGVSRQEIVATIELMSAIAGFDNAATAAAVADGVFRRRDVARKGNKAWLSRCYRRRLPCPPPS